MDYGLKNFRVAIIDAVGAKAGLDHYDLSLAKSLTESGMPTVVFSNFSENYFVKQQFDFSFAKSFSNAQSIIVSFIRALNECRKAKAEIIILHIFHSSKADQLFARLVKLFRFKLCVIVHDAESFIYENSNLNAIANKADFMVVHNQFTSQEISKIISKENNSKVSVIPHGNFIDVVLPVNAAENSFEFKKDITYLLFFGMIKKSKGLELLLEAMNHIPESVHLIIAGRPRDVNTAELHRQIETLKLTSRIQYSLRYISNEERNLLFSASE